MKQLMTFATLLVALALFLPPSAAAEDLDGKALFTETHKCNMCHAVPAAEIEAKTKSEKMKGADLGGKLDKEFAEIAAYVRKEGELDGKTHKKPFKGTDEELQAILSFISTLDDE